MAAVRSIVALFTDVIVRVPCLQGSSPEQVALGGSWGSETRRRLPSPSCGTENNDIPEQEALTANRTLIQEGQPRWQAVQTARLRCLSRGLCNLSPAPSRFAPGGFFNNNEILCKKEFGGRWRKRGALGAEEGGDQSKKTPHFLSSVQRIMPFLVFLSRPQLGKYQLPRFTAAWT